ncbi:hypothetical protein NDU88_004733 [Pleurodeles waltl]|uniref:Uncharacterized protein n=1 Tax=Pleurodeles waltl TaxID=8319 RepID=A0AAV7MUA7_PLEWA|nr:hypothetical protein NDU88_004733 [Pleurodeles waltl]
MGSEVLAPLILPISYASSPEEIVLWYSRHEYARTTTKGSGAARTTREGGEIRRSATGPEGEKESGEKADLEEEERDVGSRDREDTNERTPDRRTWETGERLALERGIKDDEATEGAWSNMASWEAERNSPPRFWRSVADPGV